MVNNYFSFDLFKISSSGGHASIVAYDMEQQFSKRFGHILSVKHPNFDPLDMLATFLVPRYCAIFSDDNRLFNVIKTESENLVSASSIF